MSFKNIGWRRILIIVLLLGILGGLFFLGRAMGNNAATATDNAATVQAVENYQAGKTTFCALNERARFYACPAMRKAMPFNGGIVVLYVCDLGGAKGYVEMMRLSAEAKQQVIAKFVESGFKVEPSCGKDDDEMIALTKAPWKTASIR